MNDQRLFCKKFFTQPLLNASVWPTSQQGADLLCSSIDRGRCNTILELGPGTGPITKQVMSNMHISARYVGIEYDMEYVSLLKKNFPQDNCQFLQADVKELSPILHDLQLHQIDLIVSGLPYMPFLQHPYLQEIIKTHIDKGAQFRAISYSPRAFRRIYSLLDPEIKAFTFWNIPPLFIMGTN